MATEIKLTPLRCPEPQLVANVAKPAAGAGQVLTSCQFRAVGPDVAVGMAAKVLHGGEASLVVDLQAEDEPIVVEDIDALDAGNSLQVRLELLDIVILFHRVTVGTTNDRAFLDEVRPWVFFLLSHFRLRRSFRRL